MLSSSNNDMNRLTIVVPTHNRHKHLRRLIAYLSFFANHIIIVDSSNSFCEGLTKCDYFHQPGSSREERLCFALGRVQTPYVMLHADDDLVTPSALNLCITYLDLNQDYSAVHGYYLSFYPTPSGGDWRAMLPESLYYKNGSDNLEQRILYGFENYSPLFYSVIRTEVLHKILTSIVKHSIFNLPFQLEFLINFGVIALGKERYLPIAYMARERGSGGGIPLEPFTHWYCNPNKLEEKQRFHEAMEDISNELAVTTSQQVDMAKVSIQSFFKSFRLMYQRQTKEDKLEFFQKWGWNYFYIHDLGVGRSGWNSLVHILDNLDCRLQGMNPQEVLSDWQTVIKVIANFARF
jgi:glycosyltransferase domain-containing protein